jgi:hypothetical protein
MYEHLVYISLAFRVYWLARTPLFMFRYLIFLVYCFFITDCSHASVRYKACHISNSVWYFSI